MVVFLTSDVGASTKMNGVRVVSKLNNTNGFVDQLKKYTKGGKNFVFIVSDPSTFDKNDSYAKLTFDSFNLSGFHFENLIIIDSRTLANVEKFIKEADLVYLAGGDPLCQMDFFEKLNLSNLLKKYKPIVIGQSAGSINLAKNAYCSPEDEEEIENKRYYKGLGLTNIRIEPHFKNSSDFEYSFSGKILLKDSKKKDFIAITDGSFIVDDGKVATIFGESYYFTNGNYSQLSKNQEQYILDKNLVKML